MRCPGFRQSHFLELSERCIRNSLNAGEIPGEHCERPHAAVQGCEGGLQVTECYLLVAPVEETGGDLPVDMRGVSGAAPAVTPPLVVPCCTLDYWVSTDSSDLVTLITNSQ